MTTCFTIHFDILGRPSSSREELPRSRRCWWAGIERKLSPPTSFGMVWYFPIFRDDNYAKPESVHNVHIGLLLIEASLFNWYFFSFTLYRYVIFQLFPNQFKRGMPGECKRLLAFKHFERNEKRTLLKVCIRNNLNTKHL